MSEITDMTEAAAISTFEVDVPDETVADLRRRLAATRWPDRETVADQSQGAQLARMQELVDYWGSGYDWRKLEARLNALPQFMTDVEGVDIHFIHVRSRHDDALPLIISHGWPGSIVELLKVIEPLTDPTAHGGDAADAFHVVIPSLPGYGFSGRPTEPGWGPDRIGLAWDALLQRLGYDHYVAQGGDWGAVISEAMGRQAPAGLAGIHVNLPAAVPADIEAALAGIGPVPEMTEQERAVFDSLIAYRKAGYAGYFIALTSRPQAMG
jgi:pimeloyl-ACP methyl ester carboxylesterase